MEDILKIVKSLEDSGLLLEGVSETIKNEAKEKKGGFVKILQLRAKFQTAMVSCSRFILTTNSSDHRRV